MWRYSVLRKPGLMLSKDMKMKIYSIAWLYSSVDMSLSSDISMRIYSLSRHIAKPHVSGLGFFGKCLLKIVN